MKRQSLHAHLPVLLLLFAVVFAAFGRVLSLPVWNPISFEVLYDAEILSRDPGLLFRHAGNLVSQPLLQLLFLAEYRAFGLDPTGYLAVNLVIHVLNAFLVYLLVNMLFARKRMAVIAALLFAFTVGSYGKILLSLANLENLLLAHLYLLVLYALIRNDFRHDGSVRTPWFAFALALFVLAGLTRPSLFSLVGCLVAYKFFFHKARAGRPVLSADLLILLVASIAFYGLQRLWARPAPIEFPDSGGALSFTWVSIKNVFRYLVLMLFPLQHSLLLTRSEPFYRLIYEGRTVIRFLLTLAIISYSFFGIVFGSRAIRFFIAWTFITVLPFAGQDPTGQWLNLKHLYLVSLGFCVILAAGTTGCSELLARHRWRRYVPYAVPLAFVIAAVVLTHKLDHQNRQQANSPTILSLRARLVAAVADRSSSDLPLQELPDPHAPGGDPAEPFRRP